MNPEEPSSNKNKIIATVAVLLVIVLIVGGISALSPNKKPNDNGSPDKQTTPAVATKTEPAQSQSAPANTASSYKDGSYTSTGSYISPGGQQSITITVSLTDGAITDTSAISGANDRTAQQFQAEFIGGYKQLIVGKKIDGINLSKVSGSSLTSQGFNEAIEQIKTQAKA